MHCLKEVVKVLPLFCAAAFRVDFATFLSSAAKSRSGANAAVTWASRWSVLGIENRAKLRGGFPSPSLMGSVACHAVHCQPL